MKNKQTIAINGEKIYKREIYLNKIRGFYNDTGMVKVLTGIRRCGKSCILLAIIDDLLEDGIKRDNIIYLNLDSMENIDIDTPAKLQARIDKLSNTNINTTNYLFIDEIQNVAGFEKIINAYRESGNYSIFITGSNSYLLSSEISTKLTGRYLSFEIFTLTFYEYLNMKETFDMKIESKQKEFENFMKEGGFPKCIFYTKIEEKLIYLKNVLEEIYIKDIKRRTRINNIDMFNDVRDYLVNNACSTISIANIASAFRAKGYKVKQETISKYIQILLDAKILYQCKNFDLKSKKVLGSKKKYYLADIALYNLTNPNGTNPYSQLLENITYLYAKSNEYSVNVGKIGDLECDFILKDVVNKYAYIQVAVTILANKNTEIREFRALEKIKDNYPKYVLTLDTLLTNKNGILNINAAEFMSVNKLFV